MTKLEVLVIFARHGGFLTPDAVLGRLRPVPDRRSLYSYLGRLKRQGLLAKANYIDAALAAEVAATIKASMNAWLNGDGNIGNGVGGHPGLHRIQVTWT